MKKLIFLIILFIVMNLNYYSLGKNKDIFPNEVKINKIYCKDMTWGGGASAYKETKFRSKIWTEWSRLYKCTLSNGTTGQFEAAAVKRKIKSNNNVLPTGKINFIKLKSCVVYFGVRSAKRDFIFNKKNVTDVNILIQYFADYVKEHPFCK